MQKRPVLVLVLVFSLSLSAFPARALACEGPACHSVNVDVRVRAGFYGGGYYRPSYGYYGRPICPIGDVGPGCVAPLRKTVRFLGRAAFRVGRGIARVGVGIGRGFGRLFFGRRCCY